MIADPDLCLALLSLLPHANLRNRCDDFLSAMADANGVDLAQFSRWYSTNGTPTVRYSQKYDDETKTFYLTLSQESNSDEPLHIPVAVGLLDKVSGREVVPTKVLDLKEETQTFEFSGLEGDVLPSVLRGFSAPVKLFGSSEDEEKDWAFLAANDSGENMSDHFLVYFCTGNCFWKAHGMCSTKRWVQPLGKRTVVVHFPHLPGASRRKFVRKQNARACV